MLLYQTGGQYNQNQIDINDIGRWRNVWRNIILTDQNGTKTLMIIKEI